MFGGVRGAVNSQMTHIRQLEGVIPSLSQIHQFRSAAILLSLLTTTSSKMINFVSQEKL